MYKFKIGQEIEITAFKHDGRMHRTWRTMTLVSEDDEKLILANEFAKVVEADGKNWFTPEPAVCVFYKKKFYNVIAMLKKDGIYFYCNLSSPALVDEEGLKYIDYDLDLRVLPNYNYEILDEDEFAQNKKDLKYESSLIKILNNTLENLIKKVLNKEKPFKHQYIEELYLEYMTKRKL